MTCPFLYVSRSQGFFTVRFKKIETTDSERSRTKGTTYPPLACCKEAQAVAMKDAPIRLKLLMLRLEAKCFLP